MASFMVYWTPCPCNRRPNHSLGRHIANVTRFLDITPCGYHHVQTLTYTSLRDFCYSIRSAGRSVEVLNAQMLRECRARRLREGGGLHADNDAARAPADSPETAAAVLLARHRKWGKYHQRGRADRIHAGQPAQVRGLKASGGKYSKRQWLNVWPGNVSPVPTLTRCQCF
jgi:hypothetical protein